MSSWVINLSLPCASGSVKQVRLRDMAPSSVSVVVPVFNEADIFWRHTAEARRRRGGAERGGRAAVLTTIPSALRYVEIAADLANEEVVYFAVAGDR